MSNLLQQINITHIFKTQPHEQILVNIPSILMNYTIANLITLDYDTHDIKNTFFIHVTSQQTFCYHM